MIAASSKSESLPSVWPVEMVSAEVAAAGGCLLRFLVTLGGLDELAATGCDNNDDDDDDRACDDDCDCDCACTLCSSALSTCLSLASCSMIAANSKSESPPPTPPSACANCDNASLEAFGFLLLRPPGFG